MEGRDTCGGVGERINGSEMDGNSTGGPTDSTNMDPRGLSDSESANKEHTQAGTRPPGTHVADVQLDLHGCLSGLSGRGCV